MFCTNCGKELKEGDSFCTNCGKAVNNNNNNLNEISQTNYTNDNNVNGFNPNTACWISLFLVYGTSILSYLFYYLRIDFLYDFLYSIGKLSVLAGIGLVIYTRVKYPQNKFAKILLIIYIITIILRIILIILLIATCMSMLKDCNG